MPAKTLFVVTRTQGPGWNAALPMESQPAWAAHAAFMTDLAARGFVVLGGPVEDTNEVLLVVRAADACEIHGRLSDDPWGEDMLRTSRVCAWTLRLGRLDESCSAGV